MSIEGGGRKTSWLDMTVEELLKRVQDYLDPPDRKEDPNAGLNQHARSLAERYMEKDENGRFKHSAEG